MLKYPSLKDHVYDYISEQIRNKTLKPGEKINENIICSALEISRTPVREALIQLGNEGYIEQIPRRGFVVKEISLERAHEIYAIIGSLEALAVTACLEKPGKLNLDEMKRIAKAMDDAIDQSDYRLYYTLQHKFHEAFIMASGNEDLIRILENLKKTFIKQSYNAAENNPVNGSESLYQEAFRKTNEEHWKIIELFEKGDPKTLRSYVRDVHWNIKYAEMEILI